MVRLIPYNTHLVIRPLAEKKQIKDEQEAWRTVDALFEQDRKQYEKALAEKDKALDGAKSHH